MTSGGRALVLGGTEFLGVHLVAGLLAQGWDVTLFNRGITQPQLFDSLARLRGDRDGDVSALRGGEWDVVYDLSAFHPDQVTRSAEHLAARCEHYVFVSTISAYADFRRSGTTEDAPLAQFEGAVPEKVDGASYGPLKALCEERVTEIFASSTIIRPTVIAGPLDPSDRFTYWVVRLGEPGQHIVPPVMDSAVQYIDVRDLAQWMVLLGQTRPTEVFNAAAAQVPFRHLADVVAQVAGVQLAAVQLTQAQLVAEEVRPWVDLPMWLPRADVDMRGFFTIDASHAVAAGLHNRPLEETVRDTLTWARGRGVATLRTGLTAEREAQLVARYGG